MTDCRVFSKWILKVTTGPNWGRIIIRSFRATLFLKFTATMSPPDPPPDPKSEILLDFPGSPFKEYGRRMCSMSGKVVQRTVHIPKQSGCYVGAPWQYQHFLKQRLIHQSNTMYEHTECFHNFLDGYILESYRAPFWSLLCCTVASSFGFRLPLAVRMHRASFGTRSGVGVKNNRKYICEYLTRGPIGSARSHRTSGKQKKEPLVVLGLWFVGHF